jgi:pimeloyl-ACP methyl ester carboxylesterase
VRARDDLHTDVVVTAPDGVLFLGPMGETPDYWDRVLEHLPDVRTVVHRRGGSADLDVELSSTWRAAESAGIRSPLVVGASLGGIVGRLLALDRPVSALVLLDSAMEDFPGDLDLPGEVRRALMDELTENDEDIDVPAAHARLRVERRPGMYGELPVWVVARGRNDWPTDPDVAIALQEGWTHRQRSLTELSSRVRFAQPEDCGHHIAVDRPDLVAAVVSEAMRA